MNPARGGNVSGGGRGGRGGGSHYGSRGIRLSPLVYREVSRSSPTVAELGDVLPTSVSSEEDVRKFSVLSLVDAHAINTGKFSGSGAQSLRKISSKNSASYSSRGGNVSGGGRGGRDGGRHYSSRGRSSPLVYREVSCSSSTVAQLVDAHAINNAGKISASGAQSLRKKSSKNSANYKSRNEANNNNKAGKVGSYAAKPSSFVSSGVLNTQVVEHRAIESGEVNAKCGAFEMHTTGFGSKMLAMMGYVEGGGLGKDGRGMAKPIELSQRPKSLGLGAEVPETSDRNVKPQPHPKSVGHKAKSTKNESQKLGLFEKHTLGFGSKMMAKMGFLEGTGLGKDSQGIVNPIAAVRLPKLKGLGWVPRGELFAFVSLV
ncbi:hypothetical protein CASFOL_025847 [Castilleja foliolosa]|uniref:G-patch domain-containing protein n=1 Tax=Castilleja foliolosa TaxID=1961234 RepID=A0ABD3CSA2_9LAMI